MSISFGLKHFENQSLSKTISTQTKQLSNNIRSIFSQFLAKTETFCHDLGIQTHYSLHWDNLKGFVPLSEIKGKLPKHDINNISYYQE